MFFFWVCESFTHQFLPLSLRISYPEAINRPTERNVLWLQTNHNYLWACFFFRNLKWHTFKNIRFSTYPAFWSHLNQTSPLHKRIEHLAHNTAQGKKINSKTTQKTPTTAPLQKAENTFFLITNTTWYEIFHCMGPLSIAGTSSAGCTAYNKPVSMLPYRPLILACSRRGLRPSMLFSWLQRTVSSVSLGRFENSIFHYFCGNHIWR